jgi:hypothetical protein
MIHLVQNMQPSTTSVSNLSGGFLGDSVNERHKERGAAELSSDLTSDRRCKTHR